MTANELWNELSAFGFNDKVTIDATGLRIGSSGHIDVPRATEYVDDPCFGVIPVARHRVDL